MKPWTFYLAISVLIIGGVASTYWFLSREPVRIPSDVPQESTAHMPPPSVSEGTGGQKEKGIVPAPESPGMPMPNMVTIAPERLQTIGVRFEEATHRSLARANAPLGLEPLFGQLIDDLVWILSFAEATVVTSQGAPQVAIFLVVVITQDRAPIAQVGARVQQVVSRAPDFLFPEGHDLHQPSSVGNGYCIAIEVTFDIDDGQDQLRWQIDARRLHVDERQDLDTFFGIADLAGESR